MYSSEYSTKRKIINFCSIIQNKKNVYFYEFWNGELIEKPVEKVSEERFQIELEKGVVALI